MNKIKDKVKDREAYRLITEAFKRQRGKGATVADIVARTSLSIAAVKEAIPAVADEYSGRLQVTESGEILYSFPRGFKSKYRGLGVFLRNFSEKLVKGVRLVTSFLFKVWIMVMLIGYFALFTLIAIGTLVLSLGSSGSSKSDRGGGLYLAGNILNLIIRLWFYSELTKSFDPSYAGRTRPKGRPLHKAIFSFVFGDKDPNADWETKEKRAIIAYIQANKGVISLPEFIILTGLKPADAESAITSYCVEFGGSPEATDDGTVIYRFDELLLRTDTAERSFGGTVPIKQLEPFSINKKSMNMWFCIINGVNTLFGGYFLFNALNTGAVGAYNTIEHGKKIIHFISQATGEPASYMYGFLSYFTNNPIDAITIGLGIVPLAFSVFFWLVPAIRSGVVKKKNEKIKLENLRKIGYNRIWANPRSVRSTDIAGGSAEMQPKNITTVQNELIKEIGSYSIPDVNIGETGETLYTFPELEREKTALSQYRAGIGQTPIGGTIFDSE
jgi:hypothetical protein